MENQMSNQQGETLLSNLTTGMRIIIISGCMFIVSLFMVWATNGFFINKGIFFMRLIISKTSGLPLLGLFTLIAAIGCILLCLPYLKGNNQKHNKTIPIIQIILSIVGIIPLILLPIELKTWSPPAHIETGGWIAIVAGAGLLIGSIVTLIDKQVNR